MPFVIRYDEMPKEVTHPVRMDGDEKEYLEAAAALDADGAGLPLGTFLRAAGHVRAKQLLGMTLEQWRAKKKRRGGS
jgi:hypothetical protein